jgi:hypothetical protein
MSTEDFLKDLLPKETNASQIIISEVKPNDVKTEEFVINHTLSEVSLGIVLLSSLVCFLMFSKIGASAQEDIDDLVKSASQVPCSKCRFFSNNPYLKCAVQPTIAMTKEAIGCSDFRLRSIGLTH